MPTLETNREEIEGVEIAFHVPDLPPLEPPIHNDEPVLPSPAICLPVQEVVPPPGESTASPRRRRPNGQAKVPRNRRGCSVAGCGNTAQHGHDICRRHGAQPKKCKEAGCDNNAVKGGVCKRHGVKQDRKQCSIDGCENNAKRGGVCIRHGAKKPTCNVTGCARYVQKAGVCQKHLSTVKPCSREGCNERVLFVEDMPPFDFCPEHSPKGTGKRKRDTMSTDEEAPRKKKDRPRCTVEGCNNIRKRNGVCTRHGAKVKACMVEGCTNNVKKDGVCIRHGATQKRYEYTCRHEGCGNRALRKQMCWAHGGGEPRKRCSQDGCSSGAVPNFDVCVKHGAKREFKICTVEGCQKLSQKSGLCIRHGAKVKTCQVEGCKSNARRHGVCIRHGAKLPAESTVSAPLQVSQTAVGQPHPNAPLRKTFFDHVDDLRAYLSEHGHLNVTQKDDPKLARFCGNCRYARNHPGKGLKMTEDRIAALDELGFRWTGR